MVPYACTALKLQRNFGSICFISTARFRHKRQKSGDEDRSVHELHFFNQVLSTSYRHRGLLRPLSQQTPGPVFIFVAVKNPLCVKIFIYGYVRAHQFVVMSFVPTAGPYSMVIEYLWGETSVQNNASWKYLAVNARFVCFCSFFVEKASERVCREMHGAVWNNKTKAK